MNSNQIAIKMESLAVSFEAAADRLRNSGSLENTPKRQRQGMSRRIEAAHNERAALACRCLAKSPDSVKSLGVPVTKTIILDATRKRMGSNGYYEVHEEDAWVNSGVPHRVIQAMIDPKNHFTPDELAAQERQRRIQKLEEDIRFVPIPGFFPTPMGIIDRMLQMADPKPGQLLLEPSAGKGDICDRVRRDYPGVIIECCEVHHSLREMLLCKGYTLIHDDCTKIVVPDPRWDVIVMNPPFERGQDMEHVTHLYRLLKPKGTLVSIVATGGFYRQDKKAQAFRQFLEEIPHSIEDLGPDAFRGPDVFRETGTNTKILVLHK